MQIGKVLVVYRFSDSQGEHFVQKWKKVLPGARSRFAVKREVFDVSLIWLHVTEGGGGGNYQWRPGILVSPG